MRCSVGVILIVAMGLSACKYDKEAHLSVGLAASEYVTHTTGSPLTGCAASLALGIAKEAYDATGQGMVDAADVMATGATCQLNFRW
ncbi:MAG: hypothetical protein AAF701_08950 [Pseudomonadota bacterium]